MARDAASVSGSSDAGVGHEANAGRVARHDAPRGAGQFGMAPIAAVSSVLDAERHRWFLWMPVLVGIGIGLYFAWPSEPLLVSAVLSAVAAAGMLIVLSPRGLLASVAVWGLFAVTTGFAVAKLRTEWVAAPVLQRSLDRAEVRGFVELVEPLVARGQRLTVRVVSISGLDPAATPRRVRVRIMNPAAGIGPGRAVKFKARLAPPGEPVLPGGYDFGRRAWYLGIGAVGFSFEAPEPDMEAAAPPGTLQAAAAIERVRLAIGAAIVAALPGQTGAIANALVTGDRGGITPDTDKAYRDSGLYHVLSISGLHMTVMAGTLFVAVRLLLAALPGVAIRFPVKKWAAVIAAFGALGYLLISGGAFATLRSYVMITIVFLAVLAERPALAMHNVALAALGLLIVWPESLLDPGFQMSFAAVAALLAAFEAWSAREERLGRAGGERRGPLMRTVLFFAGIIGSTLIAGTAVAPIAAYHFHTSQQYSALGNVLALPVCDLLVMPSLLAALVAMPFGLEAYPLAIAGFGIDAMSAIARWVGGLPGAVAAIPAISLDGLVAMVAGGLWLILWTGRWRLWGLLLIAAGIALAPYHERPDILISRDGRLVAARVDGRSLAVPPLAEFAGGGSRRQAPRSLPSGRSFELARWLEFDGDSRSADTVAAASVGFRCDAIGCAGVVGGKRLAILRHPSGARDDCATAAVLVTTVIRPNDCRGPDVVIDRKALRQGGAHAIYVKRDGRIRVETVVAARGNRPWSSAGANERPATSKLPVPRARDNESGQTGDLSRTDPDELDHAPFDGAE